MKQGTVKFSKEFVTNIGLKEWVGIEMEFDVDNESAKDVLTTAKTIVEQWHKEANPLLYLNLGFESPSQIGPSTELPVINKAEERLGINIDNSKTVEELMRYKDDCSTVYLADLWATKLSTLNKNHQTK
jgi:hypothetical protein